MARTEARRGRRQLKGTLDGTLAIDYTLGERTASGQERPAEPGPVPENNPVLRPPVMGKVGLWSKTDTTSYFKDYVVTPKP